MDPPNPTWTTFADPSTSKSQATGGARNTVKVRSKRLTKETLAILQESFDRSPYLATEDKPLLLKRIRAIKGFENFDEKRLSRWFFDARKNNKTPTVTDADILYPTVTPSIKAFLTVLLKGNSHPNPELLKIWAERLTARNSGKLVALEDVETFVRERQALETPGSSTSALYRPPTPAESTSPEPQDRDTMMETDLPPGPRTDFDHSGWQSTSPTSSFFPRVAPDVKSEPPLSPLIDRQDYGLQWQRPPSVGEPPQAHPDYQDADAMDVDVAPPSAVLRNESSRSISQAAASHSGPAAQSDRPPQPSLAPPKHTPISDAIRGLKLLSIPPPTSTSPSLSLPSETHSSSSTSPLPRNLSEVASRQSPITNMAKRFLDMLEGGKLEVLGWPKGLASDAGAEDPFE
ncbi:hypothetical protein HWV62_39527 [Athelia sp. TMB]|nr:hypothetical protein HWV62_39527 [Athelia sp. TMB]